MLAIRFRNVHVARVSLSELLYVYKCHYICNSCCNVVHNHFVLYIGIVFASLLIFLDVIFLLASKNIWHHH